MLKINLLHEKKVKRTMPGEQTLAIGLGVLALVGIVVFVFVHQPLQGKLDDAAAKNTKLQTKNKELEEKTKDFDLIRDQIEIVKGQQSSIDALNDARATPAWLLRELSNLLTPDHKPTMSGAMRERVKQDPNKRWQATWDPKRVWIESFEESGAIFTLKGGAQNDQDVTELALRLQASAYFDSVDIETGSEQKHKGSSLSYYQFVMKGEVRY